MTPVEYADLVVEADEIPVSQDGVGSSRLVQYPRGKPPGRTRSFAKAVAGECAGPPRPLRGSDDQAECMMAPETLNRTQVAESALRLHRGTLQSDTPDKANTKRCCA